MSDTSALAAALAKVQANLPKLERDRTVTVQQKGGGSYSYSYVTLAALSEAVLPLLAEHGLSFVAMPGAGSDGKMAVRYSLLHESGESLTGEFPISGEGGIQMIGGRVTYARRYCLAAIVGVAADEDDESRLADETARPAQRARQTTKPEAAAPEGTTTRRAPAQPSGRPPLPGEETELITKPQSSKLHALFNEVGWKDRDDRLRAASIIVRRQIGSSSELTKQEASDLIETLQEIAGEDDPSLRLTELLDGLAGGGES